ncbi:hypothetical protein LshimejAT787_2200690 [Lyophyllum shimeji]|uniref:Uncharacterized protein n=1 Tax=Lyophyllum shimeji TaxID=47721 RepID=A0A9P3Q2D2_LYOSH|nr:hypothetical protein LshimejAT787_2200690 [Lyophyllum shimeji]
MSSAPGVEMAVGCSHAVHANGVYVTCIEFLATIREDDQFKCPTCHLRAPGAKKWNIAPYYAFSSATQPMLLRGGAAARETFAPCRTPALVILSVRPCLTNPILQTASVAWFVQGRHWDSCLEDLQSVGSQWTSSGR